MGSQESDPSQLVSVVIPAHNSAAFIHEALSSVAAQSYQNVEVIVVDDGSTDNTGTVVDQFARQATFSVRSIRQENSGVSAARNAGIQHSTGAYIAMLDADDLFLPDKLAKQVQYLNANKRTGVVHSGWNVVTAQRERIRTVEPWIDAPKLNLKSWLTHKSVLLGAMLFRRELLISVDGFDATLRQAEDVDLVLRLSLQGHRFGWLQEPTVCYRRHGDSVTHRRALEQVECLQLVLDKFYSDPRLPQSFRRTEKLNRYFTAMWMAWYCFRMGYADVAKPMVVQTFRNSVFEPRLTWLHVLSRFVEWSEADGGDAEHLGQLYAWFRDISGATEQAWGETCDELNGYLKIWRHYLNGQYSVGRTMLQELPSAYPAFPGQLGFFISSSPRLTQTRAIHQLWNDAIQLGAANLKERRNLTGLYLSLLGRSLWERNYVTAARSMFSAVQAGYRPSAWSAWTSFARHSYKFLARQTLANCGGRGTVEC